MTQFVLFMSHPLVRRGIVYVAKRCSSGQIQAGAGAGNQLRNTQRRRTSAHQCRPTAPRNGNQLNTPTRGTTSSPTGALHMHQTRTARMHQSTIHEINLAPTDKHSRVLTEANAKWPASAHRSEVESPEHELRKSTRAQKRRKGRRKIRGTEQPK